MDVFPPGASLPLRGLMFGVGFRLYAGLCLDPFFRFVLKWKTMRVPALSIGLELQGGTFPTASIIVGCRDAVLTARGEGPSRRLSRHACVVISSQRGAMERSIV